MKKIPQQLQKLRDKIDIIDDKIIKALAKRADIVRKVGELKKEQNIRPRDTKRFDQLLKLKIKQAKEFHLSQGFIKDLYHLIHEYSIKIEQNEQK